MSAKPTAGPVDVVEARTLLHVETAHDNKSVGAGLAICSLPKNSAANAALIAEAFNVHTETGCTPRQLAEQRAELVAALENCLRHGSGEVESDDSSYLPPVVRNVARAALAKVRGGAA